MENKLNQWLAIIDATDKERMKMAIANNKVLERAQTEITYLTGDAAVRRLAELREKWEMDRVSELHYAEARGRANGERIGEIRGEKRGQKQAKEKIAKIMLKKKIKMSEIIEITGLTKEEIERLKMDVKWM